MKDITTRADLELLLYNFYKVITKDELIGHHFDDLDFEHHLPIFMDFWAKTLFDKPGYFGNPMEVHHRLHDKAKLEPHHFDRWLEVFRATVDEHFEGEHAEAAKARAGVIAKSMNERLNEGVEPYAQIKPSEE